jgi:c-di-GMP-binding flagellar brake protein YcgR
MATPFPISNSERVDLIVHQEGELHHFISQVEDVEDDTLILAMPQEPEGATFWQDGQRVEVRLSSSSGVLLFHTHVISTVKDSSSFLLLRVPPRHKHRCIQQRRFLRVRVSLPVTFSLMETSPQPLWSIKGTTCDVGGGGLRATLPIPPQDAPPLGIKLRVRLELPPTSLLRARSQVMRVMRANDPACCEVAVAFLDLAEADQIKLLQFVLRRHAELCRQRMIL